MSRTFTTDIYEKNTFTFNAIYSAADAGKVEKTMSENIDERDKKWRKTENVLKVYNENPEVLEEMLKPAKQRRKELPCNCYDSRSCLYCGGSGMGWIIEK